ncbi:MAG TPA: hypothetical protein VFT26_12185 [Pyrinomonadaceae bacterium]|nr:hypothetical protein [Pyrinomonadaceae bacterium]
MNLAQQTKGELTLGQRAMRKVLQHSRLICAYCGCPSLGVFSCGLITKAAVVKQAKKDGWLFIAGAPLCSETCERHYRLELVK